jgi:hypothetical protein
MKRVTLVKLLVNNKDEALELYTKKLGFEVSVPAFETASASKQTPSAHSADRR